LVIDLTHRGILSLPYQNRPFSLAFTLPGSFLSPHGLWGFFLVHALYLAGSAIIVCSIVRRLSPGQEHLALLAGILGPTWAPADDIRLDVTLTASYAGVTWASFLSLLLLIESYRRRSLPILLAALSIAICAGLIGSVAAAQVSPGSSTITVRLLPNEPVKEIAAREVLLVGSPLPLEPTLEIAGQDDPAAGTTGRIVICKLVLRKVDIRDLAAVNVLVVQRGENLGENAQRIERRPAIEAGMQIARRAAHGDFGEGEAAQEGGDGGRLRIQLPGVADEADIGFEFLAVAGEEGGEAWAA
jgi:hypothetical protein